VIYGVQIKMARASAASPARTAGGSGYPRHARGAGGAARDKYVSSAKTDTASSNRGVRAALDMYKLEVGRHPNTQEGLQALVEAPAGRPTETALPEEKDRSQGSVGH